MQSNDCASTKTLSPDCGMVAGVLQMVSADGEVVRATVGYTCPHCGCPEARVVITLPSRVLPELQLLAGKFCRICRDGESYIVREGLV